MMKSMTENQHKQTDFSTLDVAAFFAVVHTGAVLFLHVVK